MRSSISMPVDKQTVVLSAMRSSGSTKNSSRNIQRISAWLFREDILTTGNVYRVITNHLGYEALTIAELYIGAMERGTFLQMDKATSAYQVVLWNLRECCLHTNLIAVCADSSSTIQQRSACIMRNRSLCVYDFLHYRYHVV